MNILFYSIRWSGNPIKRKCLHKLLSKEKIDVYLIKETKLRCVDDKGVKKNVRIIKM